MISVKIAGVPEHFNFPFHLADQEGAFEEAGFEVQWIDVPEGTGRMTELLNEKAVDMAIMLTEGTLRAASKGVPLKIVQTYVESPLLWGVHMGHLKETERLPLEKARFAISRLGSGSHLMAKVMGLQNGIQLQDDQFVVVNNLQGALEYLSENPSTYFLWERFTTHPFVESGELIRQEDFPTPWPCFVWVCHAAFAEEQRHHIAALQKIINRYTREFAMIPSIDRTLSNTYSLSLDQIRQWMSLTRWSQEAFQEKTWNQVQSILLELGVLPKKLDPKEYIL